MDNSSYNLRQTTKSSANKSRENDQVTAPPNSGRADSSPTENTSSDKIIEKMQSMFNNLSDQMNQRFDAIGLDINTIKRDLLDTKRTVADLEKTVSFNAEKIQDFEKVQLPQTKEYVDKSNKELEEKLLLMEIHNRKLNLLLYGVRERDEEDINVIVRSVFSFFLNIPVAEADKILLVNCHRLPAPKHGIGNDQAKIRPIIVRFVSMADRDRVLNGFEGYRRQLSRGETTQARSGQSSAPPSAPAAQQDGSAQSSAQIYARVTIRSDLPPSMKRERGRLAAEAFKLRKDQNLSTRIRLNGSKLYLQTRKRVSSGNQAKWENWNG